MNKIDYIIRNWALRRNVDQELFLPEVGFLSVSQARPSEIIEQQGGGGHRRLIAPFYALQIGVVPTCSQVVHIVDLLGGALSIDQDAAGEQWRNWFSGQVYVHANTVAIESMMVIEFSEQGQVSIREVDPLFEQMLNPLIRPIAIDPIRVNHQSALNHRGGIRKTNPSNIYITLAIIIGILSFLFLLYMMMPRELPVKQFLNGVIPL